MAKGSDVLKMLIPEGGWSIIGNDYDTIEFITCNPISKKEFQDGFAQFDAWQAEQDAAKAAAKAAAEAKLAALGLTTDDLRALGL
jgi:hypothetical protein